MAVGAVMAITFCCGRGVVKRGALAAAVATATVGLAALGQADGIGSALNGLAGHLAHAADSIGGALQGLAEEANNVRHFY